jgi:IS30 family transposase
MRKTLTLDNGAEFAYSRLIELERRYEGLKLYYCDPYAAWQKGSVENSNRDARWYIPKGTDFANVSKESVMEVEERLGRRPLKCLEYRTPDECFLAQSIAA